MVKNILIVLIILISSAGSSFTQDISAGASTDTTAYKIGDYIYLSIQINADKNLSILGPAVSDTLAGMELISQQPPQKELKNNRQLLNYRYTFSKYDSSNITVPPIAVYFKSKGDTLERFISTNGVNFIVRPIKVNVQEDIKDVKEPLKIPLDWRWILLWVLIGLTVLSAAYYFYTRYRRKKAEYVPEKIIVKVPPHVTALNSLKALREKQLWQKGQVKEYHSEITEIIRRYFEERFGLPALEMTSGEAIDELQKREGTQPIIEDTQNFLSNADLVKFAKYLPLASVNEEMMQQAEKIVHKTRTESSETVSEAEDVH